MEATYDLRLRLYLVYSNDNITLYDIFNFRYIIRNFADVMSLKAKKKMPIKENVILHFSKSLFNIQTDVHKKKHIKVHKHE